MVVYFNKRIRCPRATVDKTIAQAFKNRSRIYEIDPSLLARGSPLPHSLILG